MPDASRISPEPHAISKAAIEDFFKNDFQPSRVILFSVFGRQHWLANALAEPDRSRSLRTTLDIETCERMRRCQVTLVDLTAFLGVLPPPEGLFGFFDDGDPASPLPQLSKEGLTNQIPQGFTVLRPSSVWEPLGALAQHFLDQNCPARLTQDFMRSLSDGIGTEPADRKARLQRAQGLKKQLHKKSFEEKWLAALALQIAARDFQFNQEAFSNDVEQALPFFSGYHAMGFSPQKHEASLRHLQELGVNIVRSIPQEILFTGDEKSTVRFQDQSDVKAETLIWGLSSVETEFLQPQLRRQVFNSDAIEPKWFWQRYLFQLKAEGNTEFAPRQFSLLSDVFLPWTHENLLLVTEVTRAQGFIEYSVCARIPIKDRFQKAYHEEQARRILAVIEQRFPMSQARLKALPVESALTADNAGPAWFVNYASEDLQALKYRREKNIIYDGPEQWPNLTVNSRFQAQQANLTLLKAKHQQHFSRQARKLEKILLQKSKQTIAPEANPGGPA